MNDAKETYNAPTRVASEEQVDHRPGMAHGCNKIAMICNIETNREKLLTNDSCGASFNVVAAARCDKLLVDRVGVQEGDVVCHRLRVVVLGQQSFLRELLVVDVDRIAVIHGEDLDHCLDGFSCRTGVSKGVSLEKKKVPD